MRGSSSPSRGGRVGRHRGAATAAREEGAATATAIGSVGSVQGTSNAVASVFESKIEA